MDIDFISNYFSNNNLGSVLCIEKMRNAAIHEVFSVDTEKGSYFIKHRGIFYAKTPSLELEPEELKFEVKATKIFHSNMPNNFPLVIKYDKKAALMITQKIMQKSDNFETKLEISYPANEEIYILGYKLGEIHRKVSKIKVLRGIKDDEYYEKNLFYKFTSLKYKEFGQLIKELKAQPRQLILGDLSPKNIGMGKTITFCDFDNAHIGNPIFDAGFLLGHIVLHSTSYENTYIENFINGYYGGLYQTASYEDLKLLCHIALATCVYRLDNKWVKYNLDTLSSKNKIKILNLVKENLKIGTDFIDGIYRIKAY